MTEMQIAELRKLLREAPKEINLFREAGADVVLTWRARDVLPNLLDEREALLEALKSAVRVLNSKPMGDAQEFEEVIAKAES